MASIIISKLMDGGIDICPHEWEYAKEKHDIRVFKCKRSGCLKFSTFGRIEINRFVEFIRKLPRIPQLPDRFAFTDEELAREIRSDPRIVKKYLEVVEGVDLNGMAKSFQADSRVFIYHDDPKAIPSTESKTSSKSWLDRNAGWIILFGSLALAAVKGYINYKAHSSRPAIAYPIQRVKPS